MWRTVVPKYVMVIFYGEFYESLKAKLANPVPSVDLRINKGHSHILVIDHRPKGENRFFKCFT